MSKSATKTSPKKTSNNSRKTPGKAAVSMPRIDALTRPIPVTADPGNKTIPIHLFDDKAALASWRETQSKTTQQWLDQQGFKLAAQACLTIPDTKGGIAQVVASATGEPALYATAGLPGKLPHGDYHVAGLNGVGIADDRLLDVAIAWGLGSYKFKLLKSKEEDPEAPASRLIIGDDRILRAATDAIRSVWLTRDLVNMPANYMGPAELAAEAEAVATLFKAKLTVIDDQTVIEAEYPAIFAVGKGSDRDPRLIDLQWGKKKHPLITLVGKGVCFDTGGYDLKPSPVMLNMKKDMGGAAQALGLAYRIMAAGLPIRLRVLIPAVENSISGRAFRPKDVIDTKAGITVEIGNTDAEGRLVLADALHVADQETPELLVDFATLTGAARVALGPDLPAMMTDDDALAAELAEIGMAVSDPVWRLPLWKPYAKGLDTSMADTSSVTTGGFAGAIIAGLFLQKFVKKTARWVHFDVYAWSPNRRPGRPEGGDAQAMRAVFAWLERHYANAPGTTGKTETTGTTGTTGTTTKGG